MRTKALITIVLVIFMLSIAIVKRGGSRISSSVERLPSPSAQSSPVTIVSTSPSPLENAVIAPTQAISITFSDPIVNKDEFRSSIDPQIDYTVTLSDDRKTVKIAPTTPYGFNQQYTIHINQLTKFDGGKKLDTEKDFHYGTVNYSGA